MSAILQLHKSLIVPHYKPIVAFLSTLHLVFVCDKLICQHCYELASNCVVESTFLRFFFILDLTKEYFFRKLFSGNIRKMSYKTFLYGTSAVNNNVF